ncbi:hypothetical protein GCM10010197_35440 [Nocardioides luteus]|uniref:Uncharacterized protein n=2 Tax=Nocardioides luteus TaxID=1844 RepID=A0ABQ5STN9_9ACTN|nr:hypothetical protein GCM10010197_35440 [Nocardioides luteus]GLJ67005.1 hypothetical protein GCM10017579_10410 [Nocardioides luteus]
MAGPTASMALPGDVFGRLTVLREGERAKDRKKRRQVWVQCDCGSPERLVRVAGLANGTRSCGCMKTERAAQTMTAMHAEKREAESAATRDPFRGSGGKVAPVVEIYLEDDVRMVVVDCPFCPTTHAHCVPVDVLPTAPLIRTSRCGGKRGGLYQIVGVPGVESEAA